MPVVRHYIVMAEGLHFETNRFNLSEEKEYFINSCCFGQDVATWLRDELSRRGIKASEPGQEDWGWYLEAEYQGRWYFISIGGNSCEVREDQNYGEWRIFVEAHRSWRERLGKQGSTADVEVLLKVIREMLEQEAGIENVGPD